MASNYRYQEESGQYTQWEDIELHDSFPPIGGARQKSDGYEEALRKAALIPYTIGNCIVSLADIDGSPQSLSFRTFARLLKTQVDAPQGISYAGEIPPSFEPHPLTEFPNRPA
jgi:hypothetical protein